MSLRPLLLVLLAVVVLAAGCGGGEPSVQKFSDAVILNRNRVDFALARITRAKSRDELLTRMDEASIVIDKSAGELADVGAPSDYQPEADHLVKNLRQLSVDVQATADQARLPGFEDLLTNTGLSFNSFDDVNKALAGLAGKGIPVTILQSH
jgi:hypothetical protein